MALYGSFLYPPFLCETIGDNKGVCGFVYGFVLSVYYVGM